MIWLYILLADLYLFFIMYVASMAMIRAHSERKLNGLLWVLCFPFVAISIVLDFINNVLLFSILFAELPKEWLVTARLKRHINKSGYRGWLSRYICHHILSPFDPTGDHCD